MPPTQEHGSAAARVIPWQAPSSETASARRPRRLMEAFAAGRVLSVETNEFDEFNECATGWSVEHHPLGSRTCRSTVSLVITGSLQVGMVRHSAAYASQGDNPPGTLTILMRVDEGRRFVHRGHEIGPMQAVLTRSGEGFECLCPSGSHFVAASVAQERIERYAADLCHVEGLWRECKDRLAFADHARLSRYRDACLRILGAVNEQPGVLGDGRAAALLEEKFLEAVLLNAHAVPSRGNIAIRYGLARKAYRYLQDRADEVPSIREICAATQASYATLERAFRETYGMTPKAMMTAMRLAGARRALLQSSPTTTVTSAALRWGFVEFGRFSVQYRQRYGELPRETLLRTRAATPRRATRPLFAATAAGSACA